MFTTKIRATLFILISMFVIQTLSHTIQNIHLHKRSFEDNCNGIYDLSLYARCDRVCEECYEIYKDTDLHKGCKSNCFNNSVFDKCVETLSPPPDADKLIQSKKQLSKRSKMP